MASEDLIALMQDKRNASERHLPENRMCWRALSSSDMNRGFGYFVVYSPDSLDPKLAIPAIIVTASTARPLFAVNSEAINLHGRSTTATAAECECACPPALIRPVVSIINFRAFGFKVSA